MPLPCGSKCWMCALVLVPSHDGSKYPTLDFLPGTRPSHSSGCLCLIHSCSHSLSLSLTHSSSLSLIAPRLLVVSLSFVVSLSHTHGLSHSFSRCFSYPLSLSRTRCLSPVHQFTWYPSHLFYLSLAPSHRPVSLSDVLCLALSSFIGPLTRSFRSLICSLSDSFSHSIIDLSLPLSFSLSFFHSLTSSTPRLICHSLTLPPSQ